MVVANGFKMHMRMKTERLSRHVHHRTLLKPLPNSSLLFEDWILLLISKPQFTGDHAG